MDLKLNKIVGVSCLFIGISVILGAIGSHILAVQISANKLNIFKTACNYLTIHCLGVLVLTLFNNTKKQVLPPKIIYALFISSIVFCSALIVSSVSEIYSNTITTYFIKMAPIAGIGIISSWFLAAIYFFKAN